MVIKLRNPRPTKTSPTKRGELYPEPKRAGTSVVRPELWLRSLKRILTYQPLRPKVWEASEVKRRTRFCSLACTWVCQSLHLKVGNQQLIQRKNRVLLIQREPPGPFLIPTNAWVNKRTLLKDKLYPREDSMGRLQTKSTPKDENLCTGCGKVYLEEA